VLVPLCNQFHRRFSQPGVSERSRICSRLLCHGVNAKPVEKDAITRCKFGLGFLQLFVEQLCEIAGFSNRARFQQAYSKDRSEGSAPAQHGLTSSFCSLRFNEGPPGRLLASQRMAIAEKSTRGSGK
jgi:hypothetical protein